ncbi:MAG: hypothetical protein JO233_08735, partial [Candidatus Eremiobacteraeota bacterium]|nr:hypothetical protein [Candidatus Eremiobacteraeota bacterium]
MNISRLCDAATAAALRFEWLDEELAPVSEYGQARFRDLAPFAPGEEDEAERHAQRVASIARTSEPEALESIREALRELPDIRTSIARAQLGENLDDAAFFLILQFCEISARLSTLLAAAMPRESVAVCDRLFESLARAKSGKFGFYLADQFDQRLAARRREAAEAESRFDRIRQELADRIAETLNRAQIATDEFIVMRDDVDGTLPQGVRVIREAPTYYLCELELDERALDALQQRDRCSLAVAAAEEAVRRDLSMQVADCSDLLAQGIHDLSVVDVTVAAARFAQRYQCVVAAYAKEPCLDFSDGHFLPLEHDLIAKNRPYVPISLALQRSNVLTGPNMGGKSAALRTAGFIALCAAFGLPVPARSATVGIFARIRFLSAGTEETYEDEQLLSSFAREVVRLREMLDDDVPALWLIDEFARTTAPDEARALLLAVLRRLGHGTQCALAATHLSNIDGDEITHFAVGGLRSDGMPAAAGTQHALRALAERMDYRIQRVREAQKSASDALELAGWLGLDKELVTSAKEILAQCN